MSTPSGSDDEQIPDLEDVSDDDRDSGADDIYHLASEHETNSTLSDSDEEFHSLPRLMSVSSSSDDEIPVFSDSNSSDDDGQRSDSEDPEAVAAFRTTLIDIRRILGEGDDTGTKHYHFFAILTQTRRAH